MSYEKKNILRDIYRIRTGMAAGEKILEENIERWAVEHLAVYFNVSVDRVKQWLLEDDEK